MNRELLLQGSKVTSKSHNVYTQQPLYFFIPVSRTMHPFCNRRWAWKVVNYTTQAVNM